MAESMNVGDLVAEFLQQVGVETAFGVVSVHNIPMLDAIGRRNRIRFVMTRGEMGAGHMADAFARVRGGLGVFFTSTGPGAANGTGALVEARFAGAPVLHLTGQTATADLDQGHGAVHDVPDQIGMLKACSKAAFRVTAPENALGILVKAAELALTPPMGPVSVEIPIDVQRARIPRPKALDSLTLHVPAPFAGDPAMLEELADIVAEAKRPLIWVGNGGKHARGPVERLAAMGVGVFTSQNGRGVLPEDHPMVVGAFNNLPLVEEFYARSDLMLIAGGRLRGHETKDVTLKLPERRVQIDVDPAAEGRTYTTEYFLQAEAGAALAALAELLEGRLSVEPGWPAEIAALKQKIIPPYKETLGPYQDFAEILRGVLPKDGVWVRDITISNTTWGNRMFPVYDPKDSIYPVGAAIGPGMQLGIGAALGAPGRKVLVMTGDGGFFLNMTELWTAVQENVDVTIMVMNDKGYGVIKDIQNLLYGGRNFFADLAQPELEKLAALAGMPFERVSRTDDLAGAVGRALAVDGPSMVEVDMKAIGPYPPYFKAPPYALKDAAD